MTLLSIDYDAGDGGSVFSNFVSAIWRMASWKAERGIPRQYTTEDLDADLRYVGGQ